MPLRITVPLGTEETPSSFTSRLAAANRLSAREFCRDFDVTFQSVVDGNAGAIATVARLGGVDPAALTAHAFIRGRKHAFEHRGQHLVRFTLRRSRVHVCPACLLNDIRHHPKLAPEIAVHNRAAWLIDVIKTCPTHSIGLAEIAADMTPRSLHDFVHHIMPALPHLGRLATEAPRRRPSGLERYVFARLDGAHSSPFLDALELHATIRTCEMIGAVASFGRTANLKRLDDDDWWQAGGAGFGIASGGAAAIGDFLRDLQRTYPCSGSATEGPQALFGRFYQWLAFGAEHPAYDPLRSLIAEHIRTHLPLGPGDTAFGNPVTERTLHSVRTLSVEAKLHPKRLRKVLQAAGIVAGGQLGLPGSNATFPAHAASEVVRRAQGALSLSKAGRHLNAPRVHIAMLAREGFIRPYIAARALFAADQYAIADLDAFLLQLLAGARMVKKPKRRQMSIPLAAKHACCSAADILRLILDRKLQWVGSLASERGYMSALVDLEEIRTKTRGRDPGGLTRRPASKRLRTTEKVVDALIEAGKLTTFVARDPVNHCPQTLISLTQLERFSREYVSLFLLAEERQQHFRRVLKDLDAQGIRPAFDLEIGARFYARSDIPLLDSVIDV